MSAKAMKSMYLFTVLLLNGCISIGADALNDPMMLERAAHVTTLEELRTLLGSPQSIVVVQSRAGQQTTYGYTYSAVEYNPWLFVPVADLIVLLCCEPVTMTIRSLAVTFDQQGHAIGTATSSGDLGMLLSTATVGQIKPP